MIINNRDEILLPILQSNISWADEVVICVAFFKTSGLNEILEVLKNKREGNVQLIVGTGFYQTEPKALLKAFKEKFQIYLQSTESVKTFHPKVYLFRKGEEVRAIIGSSNMTKGGLKDNLEISFQLDSLNDNTSIIKLEKDLEEIKKSIDFILVESRLTIDNYNVKYKKYRKIVQPAIKKAKKATKEIHYFKIGDLLEYARKNSEIIKVDFKVKNNEYDKAKNQLNHILSLNYEDKETFLKDYQIVIDCFHSSGLNRGKTIFSADFTKIIRIIRLIKAMNIDNQKEELRKLRNLLKGIKKFGINALTEILNTYYPQLFPVLNGRTMSVLSNLGIIKYKDPNSFDVENYFKYRELLTEIKRLGRFQDFRETDLVFSHYYDDVVKNKSTRKNSLTKKIDYEGYKHIWLKPIGYSDYEIPDGRKFGINERLDFANRPVGIKDNDIIIVFATGRRDILSVFKAKANMRKATQGEIEIEDWRERWNWSITGQNLTPKFGQNWWKEQLITEDLRKEYLTKYPEKPITGTGHDTFGAFNHKKDKIKLDKDFGEYLLKLIFTRENS